MACVSQRAPARTTPKQWKTRTCAAGVPSYGVASRNAAVAALNGRAVAANCAKDYEDFWDTLDRAKSAKMSAQQYADLSRTALRGYEAWRAMSGSQPITSSRSLSLKRIQRRCHRTSSSPV